MFSGRNFTIAITGLIVIGTLVGIVNTWFPPSPRRIVRDSYSGMLTGHRALYETLEALGATVRRHVDTPAALAEGEHRLLLVEPDFARIEREHDYQAQLIEWVRAGGELLLASALLDEELHKGGFACRIGSREDCEDDMLPRPSLVTQFELDELNVEGREEDEEAEYLSPFYPVRIKIGEEATEEFPLRATGSLEWLNPHLNIACLPSERPRYLSGADAESAAGRIEYEREPGDWRPLALEFERGAGRVLVLADTTPLMNQHIRCEDNAVLAYWLAAGNGGRNLVFDEFYHGNAAEGDLYAFLGTYPFGVIALFCVFAALTWVASQAVRFGPPISRRDGSRRSITEYLDAMGSLLRRGRKEEHTLRLCRDGFLGDLRVELQLDAGTPVPHVLDRLAHIDPARWQRVEAALRSINNALAAARRISPTRLFQLLEELESCRS